MTEERDAVTYAEHVRRWRRYMSRLHDLGFSSGDDVYTHFGGDVFHDGEVAIAEVDLLKGEVEMVLRNVYAVDRVTDYLEHDAGMARDQVTPLVSREDFITHVTFHGVTRLSLKRQAGHTGDIWYHQGELGRRGGDYVLEVEFLYALDKGGTLVIGFASADIEDIGPKLSEKYLGPQVDVRRFVTWVDKDPSHYMRYYGDAQQRNGEPGESTP
jgi:hypothetical protein